MSNKKNIFTEKIELSEIVLNKTDQAFAMIRQEDSGHMKKANAGETGNKRLFKTQAAVIAGICILSISSISVVAAIRHYWGRGMNGNIQASDEQQQELLEKNIAKVYREEPESPSLAVTDSGVTIVPDTVVVDERFAYMSFQISGYRVEDGMVPTFGEVNVYQGDDPEDVDSWVNMSGSMYNGTICNEEGQPVYEDGTPLKQDENGRTIHYYTDQDGNMEFIIQAYVVDPNDTLLGKTVHVRFQNLGTHSKREGFALAVEGDWNLEIVLPDVSSARDITVGQKVEGTNFTLESISISPISMKVNYSVDAAPAKQGDDSGIPKVRGVVLKDGTRLPYLTDGGSLGYTDSSRSKAYHMAGYDRVIDVDEVAALIIWTSWTANEDERMEIPIST